MTHRLTWLLLLTACTFGSGCLAEVDEESSEQSELRQEGGEEGDEEGTGGAGGAGGASSEEEEEEQEQGFGGTPLVLSFDGAEPQYQSGGHAAFDLTGDGVCHASDWPTARTPWLALDRDGDGRITSGLELFGSAVTLQSGARAQHGFQVLAELDDNGDGRIDAQDAAFSKLVLWTDDGDRLSTPGELSPLAARGVVAIELSFWRDARCDARGNCGIERAAFTFEDGSGVKRTGTVIDVHLPYR